MFDTFSGLGRTLRSLSEGDHQQQTSLSTSHQEFRLRKEIAQRSCFRFHFLHVSDFTFSRLMGEICEPILGKPSLVLRNNYFSIPEYLSLSLSSISYSVNIDRLESDYSGQSSSSSSENSHLS